MSVKVKLVKELAPMVKYKLDSTVPEKDLSLNELETLVTRINALPTNLQRQVYLYLRQYKEQKYFTNDGNHTFFDFKILTPEQQKNVYTFVELCRQDQARQETLKQLEQHNVSPSFSPTRQPHKLEDIPSNTACSERERYEKMLKFNQ